LIAIAFRRCELWLSVGDQGAGDITIDESDPAVERSVAERVGFEPNTTL